MNNPTGSAGQVSPSVRNEVVKPKSSLFTVAMRGKMTPEKVAECHRAVTKFIVKDLLPLEKSWFR